MKVAIVPFCSQQDKITGEFLIDADVTCSISFFLAEKLREEAVDVRLVLPYNSKYVHKQLDGYDVRFVKQSVNNAHRRLDFDSKRTQWLLEGCGACVLHNELDAWRVRQLFPSIKIVHFNHLLPLGEWGWMRLPQVASWEVADRVVFMSEHVKNQLNCPWAYDTVVWPMCYDARRIVRRETRDIDVLFVQRCSVFNYTHHLEFLAANVPGRVVFTDPTHYLESTGVKAEYARCATKDEYYDLLGRSKVAVALMRDDFHGGVAIREAAASGCVPVVLDAPCYRAWLSDDYPFYCQLDTIRDVVQQALEMCGWPMKFQDESYQSAWDSVVKKDLMGLIG